MPRTPAPTPFNPTTRIRRIALDFDLVLNDMLDHWVRWCAKRYNVPNLSTRDIASWDYKRKRFGDNCLEFVSAESYERLIRPLDGAVAFVRACENLVGEENVIIVSGTPAEAEEAKRDNLWEYYRVPAERVYQVDPSQTKTPYTQRALLVDDYCKNIAEHCVANAEPGIIFNRNGAYNWCDLDAYNPLVARKISPLVRTCTTYAEVLGLIHATILQSTLQEATP